MNTTELLAVVNSPLGQTLIALVAAVAGTAPRYRKTGQVPLSTLPWRAIRQLVYQFRRRFFSVERPDTQPFVVDASLDDVQELLAEQSYNPGWMLSYRYYGEDLNTRRYFYDPTRPHPHRQMHIRGFETSDGVELIAHEEPAPEHHPRAHLKEVDIHPATEWVDRNWTDRNLDPRGYQRHS